MSEIYEGYARQYVEISGSLAQKCVSSAGGDAQEKSLAIRELKAGLEEAESLIRKMDLEARSLPPAQKISLLAQLRDHKGSLNELKRDIKSLATANEAVGLREDLMRGQGQGLSTSGSGVADQRGRLLMSTERLAQSRDRVKESKKALVETEELGVSILHDLHHQREVLVHSRDVLHGVDDTIGKGRRYINSMNHRLNQHKWLMVSLIAFFAFVILFIVVINMNSSKSSTDNSNGT